MEQYLDVELAFGESICNLFTNPAYASIANVDRGFAVSKRVIRECLLFIGINPSYREQNAEEDRNRFYELSQRGNYRYFKKYEEIAEHVHLPWSHLDLLFYRETSQSNVWDLIKSPVGLDFVWNQLQISKSVIESSKPKVIVVANTLARTFLGKDKLDKSNTWLGYSFEFDEDLGFHRVANVDSAIKGTPVFFTGMLTGQSSLDRGSYERLVWHIKKATGA